jgi:hypothetical protein
MIKHISLIKGEHKDLNVILDGVENIINSENDELLMNIEKQLIKFKELWDRHELYEEQFFDTLADIGRHNPTDAEEGFVIEHKQLRGHWKVIFDAIHSYDLADLRVSLDTDGRMLIDKLRNHMAAEEKFFDKLFVSS